MLPVMLLPQSGVGINSYSLHQSDAILVPQSAKNPARIRDGGPIHASLMNGSYAWPCGPWTGSGGWEHGC